MNDHGHYNLYRMSGINMMDGCRKRAMNVMESERDMIRNTVIRVACEETKNINRNARVLRNSSYFHGQHARCVQRGWTAVKLGSVGFSSRSR